MQTSNLIIMSLVSVLLLKQRLRLDLSFNLFTTEKKNLKKMSPTILAIVSVSQASKQPYIKCKKKKWKRFKSLIRKLASSESLVQPCLPLWYINTWQFLCVSITNYLGTIFCSEFPYLATCIQNAYLHNYIISSHVANHQSLCSIKHKLSWKNLDSLTDIKQRVNKIKTNQMMYWNSSKSSKPPINASNNLMNLACELLVCKWNHIM